MKLHDKLSPEQVSCMVSDAFQTANNRIIRSPYMILGITAAVCIVDREKEKVKFLWSGDSRGYFYHEKALFQMTEDQSKAALSVKNGLYSKDDPQYRSDLNKLTAFIGMYAYGYRYHPLETAWISLKPYDMIFLMTDGISSACSNADIQSVIQRNTSWSKLRSFNDIPDINANIIPLTGNSAHLPWKCDTHNRIGVDYAIEMPLAKCLTDELDTYRFQKQNISKEHPEDTTKIITMGIDLCDALIVMHKNKMIHQDIKPQNIFLYQGNYCLGDFGIAREEDSPQFFQEGTRNYWSP